MTIYNLISFCGIFILMGIAWLLSEKRKIVNWRVILWGVSIQLVFAVFIFILPIGTKFFLFLNKIVLKVLESSMAGTKFLLGPLALGPGMVNEAGEASVGYIPVSYTHLTLPTN